MSHPARGPSVLGIDGQAIAAKAPTRRGSTLRGSGRGDGMSHPARGPSVLGIDGQAIAARSPTREPFPGLDGLTRCTQ